MSALVQGRRRRFSIVLLQRRGVSCLAFVAACAAAIGCTAVGGRVSSAGAPLNAESSTMGYAVLHHIGTMFLEPGSVGEGDTVQLVVESELDGVGPGDFVIFIDSAGGAIPLSVDSDGRFALPSRRHLLDENPRVVFNQPENSFKVAVHAEMPEAEELVVVIAADDLEFNYRELFRLAQATQAMLDRIDRHFQQEGENAGVRMAVLYLADGTEQRPVRIEFPEEPIDMQPRADGIVAIPYVPYAMEVDPLVRFPGPGRMRLFVAGEE